MKRRKKPRQITVCLYFASNIGPIFLALELGLSVSYPSSLLSLRPGIRPGSRFSPFSSEKSAFFRSLLDAAPFIDRTLSESILGEIRVRTTARTDFFTHNESNRIVQNPILLRSVARVRSGHQIRLQNRRTDIDYFPQGTYFHPPNLVSPSNSSSSST